MSYKKLVLLVICVVLACTIAIQPAMAKSSIHVSRMTMQFEDADAIITLDYDLSLFPEMYVLLLGTQGLDGEVQEIFSDFDNVEMEKIGRKRAVVRAKNIATQSSGYYLMFSHELNADVDTLIVKFPEGTSRVYTDTAKTPNTFYEY
ncbi:MAG: hypothetical protein KAH86_04310 [Methanosarcinales archaeon]|nr:hypothetical protein [Methanosarcinales archaeon]